MSHALDLLALWQTGVDAVRGDSAVKRQIAAGAIHKPDHIIAVGKAATAMAHPATQTWPDAPCLIVTKYGHAEDAPTGAQVMEAAHPVPDAASLRAGRALIDTVSNCPDGSHLLMLVSGGASSLAECPNDGLTLEGLQTATQGLLASGTAIGDMNARRIANSQIKGGKLLVHFGGARVTTLAISDVEGDSLATIGSGIGDMHPKNGVAFDPHIIASNAIARQAIADASPFPVVTNEETLYENVSTLAPKLGALLRGADAGVHVFGGEPVVHLPAHPGLGGRNMALALELAREIAGRDDLRLLVAGTDGTDGPTDAAGAFVDGQTWTEDAAEALLRADAYPWLEARGALVKTGPTGTNVMDIMIAQKM
ncbi:MAG: glycerate kinase [Tateyamaria sp.]